MRRRRITVDTLARVEGEGGIVVRLDDTGVAEARVRIFEPPRFFEAFLRGRRAAEAPDITARICGICPVAYQMSSAQAMEDALGIAVTPQIRALRRLLYCGEWIESHALHVFLLHAPDFLGYDDAIRMAADHGPIVEEGLRLKKVGNEVMRAVAGREIHPVNPRVGGFHRAPTRKEVAALAGPLAWAREAAERTVRWAATLEYPDFEQDYEFVSLRHPTEYPILDGRIVSSRGLDLGVRDFLATFAEEHVPHSNALHASVKGRGSYLVGPLARFSLNVDRLPAALQTLAREAGLEAPCRSPFKSLLVRAVEIAYACEEAAQLVAAYEPPDPPAIEAPPRAATGHGCTEAPRGLLYHRYRLDEQGVIQDARIVPPTSQNLRRMEEDLRAFAASGLDLPVDRLARACEQAVRNYDPCISCATHVVRIDDARGRSGAA
jgi:coenzyme F420-reducing hydrogenase alpha subunit